MFKTLTTIHLTTVAITLSGFLLRGIWMLRGSANLKRPVVRILPHVNDTILLVSAVVGRRTDQSISIRQQLANGQTYWNLGVYRAWSGRPNLRSYANTTHGCIHRRTCCIRLYYVGGSLPQFARLLLNRRNFNLVLIALSSGSLHPNIDQPSTLTNFPGKFLRWRHLPGQAVSFTGRNHPQLFFAVA